MSRKALEPVTLVLGRELLKLLELRNLVQLPTVEDEVINLLPVCHSQPKQRENIGAESRSDLKFMTAGVSQGS